MTAYRMQRGLTLDEMLRFCAWINASDGAYSVESVVHQGWAALMHSEVCGEEDADLSTPYAWAVAVIDQRRGVSARFVDPRQVAAFQHDGAYRRCPRYASDRRPTSPTRRASCMSFIGARCGHSCGRGHAGRAGRPWSMSWTVAGTTSTPTSSRRPASHRGATARPLCAPVWTARPTSCTSVPRR